MFVHRGREEVVIPGLWAIFVKKSFGNIKVLIKFVCCKKSELIIKFQQTCLQKIFIAGLLIKNFYQDMFVEKFFTEVLFKKFL
jgi:hypothetical protein